MGNTRTAELNLMIENLKKTNPEIYGWMSLKLKKEFLLDELSSDDLSRKSEENAKELKETDHCMNNMRKQYVSIKIYEAYLEEIAVLESKKK